MINFLEKENCIANTNPEILKEWDYEKNIVNPDDVSRGTREKVWWICSKGHSYQREVYNQRKGYGKCPICRKEK